VALTANPNVGSAVGQRHFFSIDNEMVYWNFYLDFGPLNLGHVYRFCLLMNAKLKDPKLQDKIIYFYSAEHPHKRTNAVFLITAWLLLCKGKTPEEAFAPFKGYYLPFPPWVSAFASRYLHPIHFILLTAITSVIFVLHSTMPHRRCVTSTLPSWTLCGACTEPGSTSSSTSTRLMSRSMSTTSKSR
jgi:hypothetical protein